MRAWPMMPRRGLVERLSWVQRTQETMGDLLRHGHVQQVTALSSKRIAAAYGVSQHKYGCVYKEIT